MSELTLLALAVGLGLLGFVEPCSIGANGVFLGYLQQKERSVRLLETLKFALSRAAVLGLFGLGIAFLGGFVLAAQKGVFPNSYGQVATAIAPRAGAGTDA